MKFTKYNNPRKRAKSRKKDYNTRAIEAAKGSLTDAKLGYKVPPETYNK